MQAIFRATNRHGGVQTLRVVVLVTLAMLVVTPCNAYRRKNAGTQLKGNTNAGHEFGAHLSEAERWQVVEYLKSR